MKRRLFIFAFLACGLFASGQEFGTRNPIDSGSRIVLGYDYWSGTLLTVKDKKYPIGFFGLPEEFLDSLEDGNVFSERLEKINSSIAIGNIVSCSAAFLFGGALGYASTSGQDQGTRFIIGASGCGVFLLGSLFSSSFLSRGYGDLFRLVDDYNFR